MVPVTAPGRTSSGAERRSGLLAVAAHQPSGGVVLVPGVGQPVVPAGPVDPAGGPRGGGCGAGPGAGHGVLPEEVGSAAPCRCTQRRPAGLRIRVAGMTMIASFLPLRRTVSP